MLRVMLDTNIAIYVIKRRPPTVLPKFVAFDGQMALSSITLAELLHGAEKSHSPDHTRSIVDDFCSRLEILDYDAKAAQHYGAIRTELEKKGVMIGINDLHIAAHARSAGLTLITNNTKEFRRVPALQIDNWVA